MQSLFKRRELEDLETIIYVITGTFILAEGIRDYRRRKVSMVSIGIIAVLGIILKISGSENTWLDLIGGVCVGIGLLLAARITGEKIGYGDGWMLAAIGTVMGLRKNFVLLCVSMFLCGVSAVILLLFKKAGRETELPYVCFLFPEYYLLVYYPLFRSQNNSSSLFG